MTAFLIIADAPDGLTRYHLLPLLPPPFGLVCGPCCSPDRALASGTVSTFLECTLWERRSTQTI